MTTSENLTQDKIDFYRENGFVQIPAIIGADEIADFREAALEANRATHNLSAGRGIFDQHVNVWTQSDAMKKLTLHPNVAAVATKLAGTPLRLWHDQILIKQPHNQKPTEFHQDQPYWPHADSPNPISCWIALCDVPVERGCMTFLPGSHRRTDLTAQNLADARSLFNLCPDLQWNPRITVPLRAGNCTFHHGRCAHMATPNFTDEPRVAHIVIFMPRCTTYDGKRHIVTDPLNLQIGDVIQGDLFPEVG